MKVLVEKCEEQTVGKICNIYVWNSSFLGKLYNNSDISMSPRNNFQCIHCGKVFRHRRSQYRHYLNCSRKPNLDRRIFKCDNCEKDFNRKDVLNKHKEKSHKKVKFIRNTNYSCEVCGSKLRSKLIHAPKVLHESNSCKRSFKRLDYYEK